jgi:hypothetical protein
MLKSKLFILFTIGQLVLLLTLLLYSQIQSGPGLQRHIQPKQQLVARLGLTDFAIWTEARYSRHPSQADFFSAFQDFPSSPDHFPAGSIIAPGWSNGGETP